VYLDEHNLLLLTIIRHGAAEMAAEHTALVLSLGQVAAYVLLLCSGLTIILEMIEILFSGPIQNSNSAFMAWVVQVRPARLLDC
jgi:hypothetical protein